MAVGERVGKFTETFYWFSNKTLTEVTGTLFILPGNLI